MTETTFKVQLSELATVRIICRKGSCNGIVELPVDRLANLSEPPQCPLCKEGLFPGNHPGQPHVLRDLSDVLKRLALLGDYATIEFPIVIATGAQSHRPQQ